MMQYACLLYRFAFFSTILAYQVGYVWELSAVKVTNQRWGTVLSDLGQHRYYSISTISHMV